MIRSVFLWPLAFFFLAGPAFADNVLIFPHFAQGGGYQSSFLITNLSGFASTATVQTFRQNGTPLSPTALPLPANGSIGTTLTDTALTIGWARVTTSPPADVSGTLTIQLRAGNAVLTEAGVLPASIDSSFRIGVTEQAGLRTGIAIANPGSAAVNLTLTLRNPDSSSRGPVELPLGPNQQLARFVSEIFSGVANFDGTIDVSATGAVAAVAFRQRDSGVLSATSVAAASVLIAESWFSPAGGVAARIVQEIQRAQTRIDIAIYSFTRNEIADALIAARSRGVAIRILTDADQANSAGAEAPRLEASGFQVKRTKGGNPSGDMHNKYAIFDSRLVLTGSYNWSSRAENDSFENLVFIRHPATVAAFQSNFDSIWNTR